MSLGRAIKRIAAVVSIGVSVLATAGRSLAGGELPLPMGSRVRATVPGVAGDRVVLRYHVGKLVEKSERFMVLEREDRSAPMVLTWDEIRRLEISRSHLTRLEGALMGGGIGAVLGVGSAYLGAAPSSNLFFSSRGSVALARGSIFGAIGLWIGSRLFAGDRWQELPVEQARLAVGANAAGHPQVMFSKAF